MNAIPFRFSRTELVALVNCLGDTHFPKGSHGYQPGCPVCNLMTRLLKLMESAPVGGSE